MHNRIKDIILLLIIPFVAVIQLSCTTNAADKENQKFINYLQRQYQIKIPEEKHFYILCNSFVCKGCIDHHLVAIDSLANCYPLGITIISSQRMNILSSINKSIIVKIDTEKSLDRENLNLNNLTI